jgi:hypothetical protein
VRNPVQLLRAAVALAGAEERDAQAVTRFTVGRIDIERAPERRMDPSGSPPSNDMPRRVQVA